MSIWIVLAILAVMAALLIYAACCADGDRCIRETRLYAPAVRCCR